MTTLQGLRDDLQTAEREIGDILNSLCKKHGVEVNVRVETMRQAGGDFFVSVDLSAEVG